MENKKIVELLIDDVEGIEAIALVKSPAIEINWKAFNDDNKQHITLARIDKDKKIILNLRINPPL